MATAPWPIRGSVLAVDRLKSGPAGTTMVAGSSMQTPVAVSQVLTADACKVRANGAVAAGAGTTIGLGNALAYRTDLP